jgi:hypothetical protein
MSSQASQKRGRKPSKRSIKKVAKKIVQKSRSRTALNQGIYISPPRVKYCLDSNGINRHIETAIDELRDAEPHETEQIDKAGKKTGKTIVTALISYDKISESTRNLVNKARAQNDEREKETAKREALRLKNIEDDIAAGRVTREQVAQMEADRAREAAQAAVDRAAREAARKAAGHPVRGEKRITKYSTEIELLSKMRIRFAKEAPTQVAATICAALHELMTFGMENALKDDRKILKCRHLIKPGFDQLSLSCLYKNLDVFRQLQIDEAAREKAEEAKKAAAKKAAGAAEVAAVVEPLVDDEDDAQTDDDERNFGHYVKQVCHNIMNTKLEGWKAANKNDKNAYDDIRVSLEIREFGSHLILDYIKKLWPLLRGQINSMGVKTISQFVVQHTTNQAMEFAGCSSAAVKVLIDQKFTDYQAFTIRKKAAKAAKAAAVEKKVEEAPDAVDTDVETDVDTDTE